MLIRTRLTGKKAQWLLMKRSGHQKAKTRMAGFIEPQLAYLVSEPPRGKDWIHETKFDGYRIQAVLHDGTCKLRTRTGQDWSSKYPSITNVLAKSSLKETILDGEVVALDEKGHSHFQLLQNAMRDESESKLYYYVFDCLVDNGDDLRDLSLEERKARLKKILKPLARSHVRYVESLNISGQEFLEASCAEGLEGIVSKKIDNPYESGRIETWVKAKCHQRQEFVIVGYTDPQGQRQGFGALLLGVYEGKQLRYVGKVGTGFNVTKIRGLLDKLEPLVQKKPAFKDDIPASRGVHWVAPELIAEVSFAGWTNDQMLRSPVYQGLREDKPAQEVHIEKAKDPEFTHPDKILFAEEKLTKEDVAKYYETICKQILPFCKNRPLTIFRCPNGTSEECFIQRHPNQAQDFFLINSRTDLRNIVQLSTIELHGWNCQLPDIEIPDQLVMDLDPGPGIAWTQVIQCALDIREYLVERGLESFVKLSGGKGLHVHVPLGPTHTWDQVSSFAKNIAASLAQENTLYISQSTKSRRSKKIYIDYLRNSRGTSAVLPYSLRAKETSSVAMPVAWSDLKKIKSAAEFTLEKALKHIKARTQDPWKGYWKLDQVLPAEEVKKRRRA